jgi:hypothetical protein
VRSTRTTKAQTGGAARTHATGEVLPAWAAPVAYALVTVLLFREFFFQGALLLGRDTYALSYFARNYYTTSLHELHRFPLWDPLLFGGLPFVDGMHGDIFYPPSLALLFMDTRAFWGWKMVLHVYAAGLFTFLWLRGIGLGRGAAFFGGLVYMMGADLISLVMPGGDGKLFVSALAPLTFWLVERCVRKRRPADFALFALGLALVVFTSHMQLAYFTVWGVSLYFLFRVWQVWRAERRASSAAVLVAMYALAGLLGVGAATVQFVPPLGYLREWSHRADRTVAADRETAYQFSTTYALHAEELVSLVVPEFVGDNVPTDTRQGNTYWGRNPFKINNEYAGLVPLLLIPLVLLRRRTATTWFFCGLAIISILYALGSTTPFFRLFYLVPGVKLFRAPSIIIFLYGLSVATLGALAVQRALDGAAAGEEAGRTRRVLWIVAAVFGVLALAQSAGVITNLWQSLAPLDRSKADALAANLPAMRTGFWISFLLAAGVAGVWEALTRGWLGARAVVLTLSLLVVFDLYRVDRPFIRNPVLIGEAAMARDPVLFQADEAIRFLQDAAHRGEVFRVYDLGWVLQTPQPVYPDGNTLAVHGIEQLAGHHGNEIGRYRALVGGDDGINVAASQLRLLDLANVEYVLSPGRIPQPGFEEVMTAPRPVVVYRNTNALPRAYLVGNVEVAPDSQAVQRLLGGEFPMRTTVLLPEALPAGVEVRADPQGEVTWVSREADRYTLRVRTDRPALLVISDNYYPAWQAEIDGTAVPVLRANYTFRALPVPAGEHEVRFHYQSDTLRKSALASIVVLATLLLVALTGLRRSREGTAS